MDVVMTRKSNDLDHLVHLNVRRLLCPMPVIRLQEMISQLSVGQCVQIDATDPGALHDIPTWARIHGHVVEQAEMREGGVVIRVRIGPGS